MLITDEARDSLKIDSWWDWVVSRSYVLTLLRVALLEPREATPPSIFPWETRPDFNIAWKDYSWSFYEAYFREMAALLKQQGARLAVVVFPFEPQLTMRSHRDDMDYILKPQRHLAALCQKYAVPCLDLYSPFERAYDGGATLFRDGIHLNPAGHQLTAAALVHFLDERGLVPGMPGAQGYREQQDGLALATINRPSCAPSRARRWSDPAGDRS